MNQTIEHFFAIEEEDSTLKWKVPGSNPAVKSDAKRGAESGANSSAKSGDKSGDKSSDELDWKD